MLRLSTFNSAAPTLEQPVDSPITSKREQNKCKPHCKIASSRQQWEAALGLVYRAYVRAGLIRMNPYRMRVTPHHGLSTTEVLIAGNADEVLCTLSVIGDGQLGLPMEAIFPEQIERLRSQGLRLAEVSCLADERNESDQSFPLVARLMALTAQYAVSREIDQLMIAVHPRHAKFYERFLGFNLIGETRTYASVCDHPAVAMALDLGNLAVEHPRAHRRLFGVPFADDLLKYQPVSRELRSDLQQIAAETYLDQSTVLACA